MDACTCLPVPIDAKQSKELGNNSFIRGVFHWIANDALSQLSYTPTARFILTNERRVAKHVAAISFRPRESSKRSEFICGRRRAPCGGPFGRERFSHSPGIFELARECVQIGVNESLPSKLIRCRRRARWHPPG